MKTNFPNTIPVFSIALLMAALCAPFCSSGDTNSTAMATKDFEFVSGNKKLSGIIDQPVDGGVKAIILFVHGSGATDIRAENRYSDLRRRFVELGIACITWDKPGAGRSEGMFDANQSVYDSAQEILDAVAQLRARKVPGSKKVGIWSTSSGCWVSPIAMSRDASIKFWISVSGVPAEDNKYYLLKSNLPLEGRTAEETARLMKEWTQGRRILLQGGNYDAYLSATENLRKDPSVAYMAGDLTGSRKDYEAEQAAYLKAKDEYSFDEETLSVIRVKNFTEMLSRLNIDVLALFGEKDTNVNWRGARALYESTVGRNPNATLTTRTFPDGNHNIVVSKTGSIRGVEGVRLESGEKCKGYYDTQIDWLRKHVVSE